jgi:hypothetical protein
MLKDGTSMSVITLVTLVYLPSTFVAVCEHFCACIYLTEHLPVIFRYGILRLKRRCRSTLDLLTLRVAVLRISYTADFIDTRVLEVESQSCSAVKDDAGSG